MECITVKYLSIVKVPVVNDLPENEFSVLAINCSDVPAGFTVFVDKNGKLFAIKKTDSLG